ncbi:MAG: hypothetical protein WA981_15440 [Glaciecola sp.]
MRQQKAKDDDSRKRRHETSQHSASANFYEYLFEQYFVSFGALSKSIERSGQAPLSKDEILNFAKKSKIQRQVSHSMRHCKIGQKHANLLLHTALRNKADAVVRLGNCNVMPIVSCAFAKISAFTDAIHSGSVRGGQVKD